MLATEAGAPGLCCWSRVKAVVDVPRSARWPKLWHRCGAHPAGGNFSRWRPRRWAGLVVVRARSRCRVAAAEFTFDGCEPGDALDRSRSAWGGGAGEESSKGGRKLPGKELPEISGMDLFREPIVQGSCSIVPRVGSAGAIAVSIEAQEIAEVPGDRKRIPPATIRFDHGMALGFWP